MSSQVVRDRRAQAAARVVRWDVGAGSSGGPEPAGPGKPAEAGWPERPDGPIPRPDEP